VRTRSVAMQAAVDEIDALVKLGRLPKGAIGRIASKHGVSYPGLCSARAASRAYMNRPLKRAPRTEMQIRRDLKSMLEEQYRAQQQRWGFV